MIPSNLLAPLRRVLPLVLLALFFQACKSGSTSSSGGDGTIAITLTSSNASIVQGGTTSLTATLTRAGGFTGLVTISATGAPTGVTAGITNVVTTGTTTTALVTIVVAADATAGSYTITVHGQGSGVTETTAAFALTITAVATPNYSISLAPANLTLVQGTAGNTVATLTRTGGFTGSVNLSLTGAPSGVTATFTPNNTTGNTSTVAVTVGASVAAGVYTVYVGGVASGQSDKITPLVLTVTASSGGGGNVSINFSACAAANKPLWVAYQNGTGAWTAVTGVSDAYSFTINAGKGGFAYVTQGVGDAYQIVVGFYTQAELAGSVFTFCAAVPTKTNTGIVAGLAATDGSGVYLGGTSAGPSFISPSFTLTGVASGAQDLVGWRRSITTPGTGDRGFIRRDVNQTTGTSLGTLDFTGAESFAASTATLTIANTSGGTTSDYMLYSTGATCSPATLYSSLPATTTILGVPLGSARSTDYYTLQAGESGPNSSRSVSESFKTFGNHTSTLPTALPTPVVTSLGGAYKRLQAVFTLPSEYQSSITLQYFAGTRFELVTASFGWMGGTAATIALPDFSAAAGWNSIWGMLPATTASWTVGANGTTLGGSSICVEGGKTVQASASGTN